MVVAICIPFLGIETGNLNAKFAWGGTDTTTGVAANLSLSTPVCTTLFSLITPLFLASLEDGAKRTLLTVDYGEGLSGYTSLISFALALWAWIQARDDRAGGKNISLLRFAKTSFAFHKGNT